jgi:hypothetical protein
MADQRGIAIGFAHLVADRMIQAEFDGRDIRATSVPSVTHAPCLRYCIGGREVHPASCYPQFAPPSYGGAFL